MQLSYVPQNATRQCHWTSRGAKDGNIAFLQPSRLWIAVFWRLTYCILFEFAKLKLHSVCLTRRRGHYSFRTIKPLFKPWISVSWRFSERMIWACPSDISAVAAGWCLIHNRSVTLDIFVFWPSAFPPFSSKYAQIRREPEFSRSGRSQRPPVHLYPEHQGWTLVLHNRCFTSELVTDNKIGTHRTTDS